jgi:hypothetical protein
MFLEESQFRDLIIQKDILFKHSWQRIAEMGRIIVSKDVCILIPGSCE